MADPWLVEIATLRGDRTVLEMTEARDVSFERYIGKIGSFSATVAAPSAAIAARLAPLLRDDAGLTLAAYISRGREIWWGGRLDDPQATIGGREGDEIKISGTTFEVYPDDRTIYDDITWDQVDQLEIARQIWAAVLEDEGDIGVTLPDAPASGIRRDMTVKRGDKRTYGSVLSEISGRDGGFEWVINCYRDGDTRRRVLLLGYPQLGGGPGPTLDYPGSIIQAGRSTSTKQTGTRFWAIGGAQQDVQGGDEQPPISTTQTRIEGLLMNGAVLLDKATTYSDVTIQATLDDKNTAAAAAYGRPLSVISATVALDKAGPAILGTSPRLRISHPFWPGGPNGAPGVDARQRVIGIKVKPPERGAAGTVELVFEQPDEGGQLG